jgi:chromosome segregation ATPase
MDDLLAAAVELERRDEVAAALLRQVEELKARVDGIRVEATATAAFLGDAPAARARLEQEQAAFAEALARARAALAGAEAELERAKEPELPAARRAVEHARDAVRTAEHVRDRTQQAAQELEAAVERREAEAAELEQRAAGASSDLAALPRLSPEATAPPGAGLDGVIAWAERVRAAVLLAWASISGERERIVREAIELASVGLGEAVGATSVAGLRERIERSRA